MSNISNVFYFGGGERSETRVSPRRRCSPDARKSSHLDTSTVFPTEAARLSPNARRHMNGPQDQIKRNFTTDDTSPRAARRISPTRPATAMSVIQGTFDLTNIHTLAHRRGVPSSAKENHLGKDMVTMPGSEIVNVPHKKYGSFVVPQFPDKPAYERKSGKGLIANADKYRKAQFLDDQPITPVRSPLRGRSPAKCDPNEIGDKVSAPHASGRARSPLQKAATASGSNPILLTGIVDKDRSTGIGRAASTKGRQTNADTVMYGKPVGRSTAGNSKTGPAPVETVPHTSRKKCDIPVHSNPVSPRGGHGNGGGDDSAVSPSMRRVRKLVEDPTPTATRGSTIAMQRRIPNVISDDRRVRKTVTQAPSPSRPTQRKHVQPAPQVTPRGGIKTPRM